MTDVSALLPEMLRKLEGDRVVTRPRPRRPQTYFEVEIADDHGGGQELDRGLEALEPPDQEVTEPVTKFVDLPVPVGTGGQLGLEGADTFVKRQERWISGLLLGGFR